MKIIAALIILLLIYSLRRRAFIEILVAVTLFNSFTGYLFIFNGISFNKIMIVLYLSSLSCLFLFHNKNIQRVNDKKSNSSDLLIQGLSFSYIFFISAYLIYNVTKGLLIESDGVEYISLLSNLGYLVVVFTIYIQRGKISFDGINRGIVFGGLMLGILCLFQYFFPNLVIGVSYQASIHHENLNRVLGLHGNPNACGLYLGIAAVVAIKKALELKSFSKWFYFFVCFLVSMALFFTYSRSSIAAGLLGLFLMYCFFLKVNGVSFKSLFPLIVIAAILVVGVIFLLQRDFFSNSMSDADRFLLWEITYKTFIKTPLLGIWRGQVYNVHNGFLEIIFLQGIVGFFLFTGVVFSSLIAGLRSLTNEKGMLLCLIAVIFFNNLFHSMAMNSIILWILMALMFVPEFGQNFIENKE